MDFGLLVARLVLGVLMAAHGSQKLFGWFGGYGLNGTAGFFERHDLDQILNQIRADRPRDTARVMLFGISLGAAVKVSEFTTTAGSGDSTGGGGTTATAATLRVLQWNTHHGGYGTDNVYDTNRMASWIAAATSYSTNNRIMVPFYIYYSMFGFQRVGDFIWAAADARCRGFLLGGTAGRTTLAGEGLQHRVLDGDRGMGTHR